MYLNAIKKKFKRPIWTVQIPQWRPSTEMTIQIQSLMEEFL